MRTVPQSMAQKLQQRIQTLSNDSDPRVSLRLRRPNLPIESGAFFERKLIDDVSTSPISDTAIAVEHSKPVGEDGDIWVSAIVNQTLRIFKSKNHIDLSQLNFVEQDFTTSAIYCSMEFDSKLYRDKFGKEQFITEKEPYVFWVNQNGDLHAKKLPNGEDVLLETNVKRISTVRGYYSDIPKLDAGLIIFYTNNNDTLYYKQLIHGVWYDSEEISAFGDGVISIAAFRTDDYRVGVEVRTDSGGRYAFSFSETNVTGIRNVDNVKLFDTTDELTLFDVPYVKTKSDEHIEISMTEVLCQIWPAKMPEIIDAYNTYIEPGRYEYYTGEGLYAGEI